MNNIKIDALRFFPLATNYDEVYEARTNKLRPTALNAFDVLKIAHDAPYSDTFVDRFHLADDYKRSFDNYQFINTRGIADEHNKIDGWEMLTDGEIGRLKEMGITYPDYSMLTSESDVLRNPYPIAPGQERQPTHTMEHTIYAMPGDIVPLYPYYGLPYTINFKENFTHWYDFTNGGAVEYTTPWNGETVDLLDFLVDPSGVQRASGKGFFGGQYMSSGKKINVSTVEEYIEAVNYVNDHDHNEYINITADLDFTGRTDVPMIGPEWGKRFSGVVNGNGHRITNLVINRPDESEVGLISRTDGGAVVENLIIDNSCSFIGKRDVGLIGYHAYNRLTIWNVHTEATVMASNGQSAGLVGYAAGGSSCMTIENCYVGGDIGPAGPNENAALVGWFNTSDHNVTTLHNVVVHCKLSGYDGNAFRKYIRSSNSSSPLTEEAGGVVVRGDLRFSNCHGLLDLSDKAWTRIQVNRTVSAEGLSKLGWSDQTTPPMSQTVSTTVPDAWPHVTIGDEADYIAKVNEINNHEYYQVYVELTQDLDFSAYGPADVPMFGEKQNINTGGNWEFAGIFNGKGHTIKNLRIIRNNENVGMFAQTRDGARIENLIIDSSCYFQGTAHIGLVGKHRWNPIYFRNVKTEATVHGTNGGEQAAAALVGYSNGGWSAGTFDIENVYIGGEIGNPDNYSSSNNNAVICGWQTDGALSGTLVFKNIVVDCELYGSDNTSKRKYLRFPHQDAPITMEGDTYIKTANNGQYRLTYTNCFGNIEPADTPWQLMDEEYVMPEMAGWTGTYPTEISKEAEICNLNAGRGSREGGSAATFFCPRNPLASETIQSLPLPEGKSEYVIAADLSHTYNPDRNLDMESRKMYEPIISSRHIFRIRDGKAFADEISGTVEGNRNYLRKIRKFVTLRKNSSWQLRLDNPVPKTNSSAKGYKWAPSHYYYIDANGNYRRVPQMKIVVRNADTYGTTSSFSCSFTNTIPGYGSREIDGVKYATGEAYFETRSEHPDYHGSTYTASKEYEYDTMITGTAFNPGHYLVQIVAYDHNGNQLTIKGTGEPLVLMEYDFTVLPEGAALIERMDNLYSNEKYSEYTPEALDEKYGSPTVKIDFDEYMAINKLPDSDPLKAKLISHSTYLQTHPQTSNPDADAPNTPNGMQKTWFKWPVPWGQSSYMFGYNLRYDYSMYQLASHSDNVVWKWKAMEFPESSDPTSMSGNYAGDGEGIYDRRYYASKLNANSRAAAEQGYFYYVNAASDPGVTASLKIDDLCQGSRVVVSAWISEFSSTSERGNLSFNFVAVLKDNVSENYPSSGFVNSQRIILHKYITGYPAEAGNWYNVYYSFLPRLAEFSADGVTTDMVDHYELELDNNAKNSNGADYAVDDIRVYVVPPASEIRQLRPVCNDYATRMKLSTPFYTLLELARVPEAAGQETTKDMNVYYTILDKEKFDNAIKGNKSYAEAYAESVVSFRDVEVPVDDETKEIATKTFDTVIFKSRYTDNGEYNYDPNSEITGMAFREEKNGERIIVFESDVKAGVLTPGKKYYFILRSPLEDETVIEGQEYLFFDMQDRCACVSELSIQGRLVTKWDGEMVSNIDDFTICPNQYPVIQVNILGNTGDDSGKSVVVEENAYIDWFDGTYDEFMDYTEEGNSEHTLKEALGVFRIYYPTNRNLDDVVPKKKDGEENFEQWMIDLISRASMPTEEYPLSRLKLYESSYVVPAVTIPDGETEVTKCVVAVQRNCDYGDYWVCTDPQEIPVTVRNISPMMLHGLPGINYPENMLDVPLRIGLDQLRTDNGATGFTMKRIDIPVRKAMTATDSKKFKLTNETFHISNPGEEATEVERMGAVILVNTDDPEYKHLGTENGGTEEGMDLLWVGEVKTLEVTADVKEGQYFSVEFDDSFVFKEGYQYKMRFQYEVENQGDGVCQGHDVFTLKIVPKYLAWTGDRSLNWNDDANWRRVGKDDLLLPDDTRGSDMVHYITDGNRAGKSYSNTAAFAPLDFTHVIVEGGNAEAPYMYAPAQSDEVKDAYDWNNKTFSWPKNPDKGDAPVYADDPGAESVGAATPLIHYDMAAFDFGQGKGRNEAHTGCRPWYANTCREIHFKPDGTLMNQHELVYRRAWVDVELDPMRWYTLALPMKEVVAGDFYLPAAGARQLTELYQDIRFDEDINDRFRPAVFQRGWDKSEARVYELEHPGFDNPRNVAIRAFWSHVYNDVTEQYGAGTGFSVKTDVSGLGSDWSDRVLFRFPKADESFLYYNQAGDRSGHSTAITRTDAQYRLSESHGTIKASTATTGKYFLVGNPFVTHLDIEKFLNANSDVLERKYWIVTAKGQISGSVDAEGNSFVAFPSSNDDEPVADPTVVAPMQGFFVETKNSTDKVELKYDETMMRRYDVSGQHLTATARSMEETGVLKVTAYNYGMPSSAAIVVPCESRGLEVNAIDNRDIDVAATVYSVKDNNAVAVNMCVDMDGMEIGVLADEDTETILRFEGVEAADGLCLYDKADGSVTELEEGMEIVVVGQVTGRLFLISGLPDDKVANSIVWKVSDGALHVTDTSHSGYLSVRVCDTIGRVVVSVTDTSDTVSIPLQPGIYMAEIVTASERKGLKIRL